VGCFQSSEGFSQAPLKSLYKSTIIIWSEYDPSALEVELTDLVHQAEDGDAYCSTMDCVFVPEPEKDTAWDGTEFFVLLDDDEEGEVPATGPDNHSLETKSTSERVLPDNCQVLPVTEAPHFCPKCLTDYGCEDEPCTAFYELTCKSCIAGGVDCDNHTATG
jgi:hypothetical protein